MLLGKEQRWYRAPCLETNTAGVTAIFELAWMPTCLNKHREKQSERIQTFFLTSLLGKLRNCKTTYISSLISCHIRERMICTSNSRSIQGLFITDGVELFSP